MKELFTELKAVSGGDIGIQLDIFGNCFIHRSIPKYEVPNTKVIVSSDNRLTSEMTHKEN